MVSFLALPFAYRGGVRLAAGDLDGDGRGELLVGMGPDRAGTRVRVFDLQGGENPYLYDLRLLIEFRPFGTGYRGGVLLGAGDLNLDERAEFFALGRSGLVQSFRWPELTPLFRLSSTSPEYQNGLRLPIG